MAKPAVINIINANIPNEQKSDDALIMLFQSGEQEVFRYLVERYREKVRNVIFSIFNDADQVDDISQEVFIKVFHALPNFRFESSFYTWVYRIAVNKCRDELRKKKVKRFFSFHSFEKTTNTKIENLATTTFDDENIKGVIEESLKKLPEKFRMPIILKDIDGMSYDEIADVLDCEVGTVKSRLSRGRTMLREILMPILV
ncbi:MAG: sigma-70 family RNA polymerase sigma factor [Bacteriovoracaceae bacterium]|nr:sigma-70 family RNA polymerase sigma factor [Bacteroidota bacterium]